MFNGMGRDNAKKKWFTCEMIWSMNRIRDEELNIAQLETMIMDRALTWYMNYKSIFLAR